MTSKMCRDRLLGIVWASLLISFSLGQAFASEPAWPDAIKSSGGHFFAKPVELPVADFAQDDPRWSQECLGPTNETLTDEGCTLTSVVMVLNFYGVRSNPSTLNHFLNAHDGFDREGLLDFDRVSAFASHRIQLAYQGAPSYDALDREILAHHPVIVQLTLYDGDRHFVVVVGKQGFDYLVRDPAADPAASLVLLKTLSPQIEQQFLYLKRN